MPELVEVKLVTLICRRCRHTWTPRHAEVRVCPRCKSAWFDTPPGR